MLGAGIDPGTNEKVPRSDLLTRSPGGFFVGS